MLKNNVNPFRDILCFENNNVVVPKLKEIQDEEDEKRNKQNSNNLHNSNNLNDCDEQRNDEEMNESDKLSEPDGSDDSDEFNERFGQKPRNSFGLGKVSKWFHENEIYKNHNKKKMIWSSGTAKDYIQYADNLNNEKLDPNEYLRFGWSTQVANLTNFDLFDKDQLESFTESDCEIFRNSNSKVKSNKSDIVQSILNFINNETFTIDTDNSFLQQIENIQRHHLQSLIALKWMEKCLYSFKPSSE